MNIIFLDVDGVILPWQMNNCDPPKFPREHRLEVHLKPDHIDLVNKLASDNNAEIVVSSTWRMHDDSLTNKFQKSVSDYQPFDLRSFLKRSGLTASFAEDWHTPMPERFGEIINGVPRGVEIFRWLQNHPEVTNWVSLDDDSSGFAAMEIRNHLAKTDPTIGLTEQEFNIANIILKGV
jgi:hypothetical protein